MCRDVVESTERHRVGVSTSLWTDLTRENSFSLVTRSLTKRDDFAEWMEFQTFRSRDYETPLYRTGSFFIRSMFRFRYNLNKQLIVRYKYDANCVTLSV